jgi:uncharacterized protein YvpB
MANLKVNFKSQWDEDARGTENDCGPASIAMILNYYGENVTTDEVYGRTKAGNGLITIGQLQEAISSYGYTSKCIRGSSPDQLKSLLDNGLPVICLVHYGDLSSRQDKNFQGGHFFLTVGYYRDGYYVNDPNFWGDTRKDGDHHNYLKGEFEKAWVNASLDDNPPNTLIYIEPKKLTMTDDKKLALELLDKYKQEADHGNLEGAMRSLLGSKDADDKLKTLESKLEVYEQQLKDVDEMVLKRIEGAVNKAVEKNDEKWQTELKSAKWKGFNDATWPEHLGVVFQKLFNFFTDKIDDVN